MANNNGRINFDVGFSIDRNQLESLKNEFKAIQQLSVHDFMSQNNLTNLRAAQSELNQIKNSARELNQVLTNAFNVNLGSTNITKLNQEIDRLAQSGRLQQIYSDLSRAGSAGLKAFNTLSSSVMQSNLQLKQTHKILDEIAITFKNTVKWTATSSIVNRMADSIQAAWTFTKGLDTDLNDIRIVTGKSADEMERFARQANKAAQDLGAATRDYTQASLIFYQQGLEDEEVNARTNVTLKAANVTGQQASEVSEQLTAVWNGYRVSAEETEAYVDKLAAVGANTASNLEELSTAMSKVASAANTAGVPIDNLNAILSTVISVTREAPETIGTAFKTIFARLGDLSLGGTDEEGIGLGNVSTKLHNLGVEVLDQQGNMREMGDIIEDVAAKWQTWTRAQQQAAAVAMAGKMQYSRLISLFENWDMYTDALNISQNALGTLSEQQDIYMESTEAHLQKLQTSWDRVFNSVVNNESVNNLLDGITFLVDGFGNLIESIGGGGTALAALGAIGIKVFSQQIAAGLNTTITNMQRAQQNARILAQQMQAISIMERATPNDAGVAVRKDVLDQINKHKDRLSPEQIQRLTTTGNDWATAKSELQQYEADKQRALNIANRANRANYTDIYRDLNIDTIDREKLETNLAATENEANSLKNTMEKLNQVLAKYTQVSGDSANLTDAQKRQYQQLREQIQNLANQANLFKSNKLIQPGQQTQQLRRSVQDTLRMVEQDAHNVSQGQAGLIERIFYGSEGDNIIQKLQRQIKELIKQTESDITTLRDVLNQETETQGQRTNDLQANEQFAQDRFNEDMRNVNQEAMIEHFTKLAASITEFTTAFSIAANLPNIWENQDLSAGEKILQTVMNLSMALPMFINGWKTIVIEGQAVAGTLKQVAFNHLSAATAARVGSVANMTLTTTFKGLGAAIWTALAPLVPFIAAIGAVALTIAVVEQAVNKEANAVKESAVQTQKLKEAYQETKQAADNFKNTLNDYNSAVDNIKTLTTGTDEYKTAIIEANEKAIDLLKTNKDLAKYAYTAENGLISFTEEGINQVLEKQYEKVASTQINYLNNEIDTLQKQLTSDWTNFARQRNKEQEQLNKKQQSYLEKISATTQTEATINDTTNKFQRNTKYSKNTELAAGVPRELVDAIAKYMKDNNFSDLSSFQLTNIDEFNNATKDVQDAITNNIDAYVKMANTINQSTQTQKLYAEQMTQAYLQMKGIIDDDGKLSVNEILATRIVEQAGGVDVSNQDINNRINNMSSARYFGGRRIYNDEDEVKKAIQYYEKTYGVDIRQSSGWNNISLFGDKQSSLAGSHNFDIYNLEGINTDQRIELDDIMKLYLANQIRDERSNKEYINERQKRMNASINETLSTMNVSRGYQDRFAQVLAGSAAGKNGEFNLLDTINTTLTQKGAQEFADMWQNLDQEAKTKLLQELGYTTEEAIKEAETQFSQALQNRANLSDVKAFGDTIKSGAAASKSVTSDLLTGKLTSENAVDNKSLQTLLSDADALLNLYPDLTNEVEILNKTALIGSETWAAALDNVKTRLNSLNVQRVKEELKDATKAFDDWFIKATEKDNELDLEVKLKDKDFKNYLDDVLNANYAIDIELHAQAEDAFETFATTMDAMEKLAGKIGEDYLVAASDLRELNNVFPDIWENMEYTEDGMVKLNETSVKLAIQAAEENLKASAEETLGKLQNQKTELSAQRAKYQAILETAKLAQEGQITSEKAVTEIHNQLQQIQSENDAKETETELENAKMVADDSNTNAGIVAANWDESAHSAANSMLAFGQQAIKVFQSIASGGAIPLPDGYQGKVSYQGQGGQTNSQAKIADLNKNIDEALGATQWDQIIAQTETAIALVDKQINDINGMIVETGARLVSGGKTLNNVASGKGAKPKSGSSKDPDQMDYLEDQKDFYHDINLELKKYETELNRLQKAQEKLFGQDLIENYNEQLENLNKTIDATNRKIEIARGEMKLVGDYLAERGVMFDADGYISNYTQIYEDKLRTTNGIIDAYNKMSAEEQENYKDAVEAAKKDFDEFVENINRYDEIVSDLIPGLIDDIQEAQDKQIEISISKFNMAIELELDTAKLEKDWAKFQRRIIKDITDKNFGYIVDKAKDILETEFKIFYDENNSGVVQDLTQHVLNTQRELEKIRAEGWSEVYGDNAQQALEDLKNYHSELMNQMEEYQDMIDEIRDSFGELMDEAASRIEEQIDLYGQLRNMITHDMSMIKMLYGEDSYEALAPYYEQMQQQYVKELQFQKDQVKLYEDAMNAAEQYSGRESQEWRNARKIYIDALEAWDQKTEEATQNAIDRYVNAIDLIFQNLENKITRDAGLKYVSEEWELINKSSDMYLDNLNAMYEVQKLAAKYQDAFDQTSSLSAQRAIRELQESELKDLRERDKLTKYDIDRANLKYELMLRQIALEEAQQNKSSLRLRRDSQGNYTYQYVADEDAVKKAEQELGDVYNELYNLDRDRYKNNLDQAYTIYEEFHQKMRDLAANTTMDTEEKERWKALYVEQYGQMINDLLGENELIRQNLRESALAHHMYIMDTDRETFEQMTDAETQDLINKFIDTANPNSILSTHQEAFATVIDLQGQMEQNFEKMDNDMVDHAMNILAPGWHSAVQLMISDIKDEGGFEPVVLQAITNVDEKMIQYGNDVATVSENSRNSFQDLKNNGLDPTIESTDNLISATDGVIGQYDILLHQMADSGGVLDILNQLTERFNNNATAARNAADAAYEYIQAVNDKAEADARYAEQQAKLAKANVSKNVQSVSRISSPSSNGNSSSSGGGSRTTSAGTASSGGGSNILADAAKGLLNATTDSRIGKAVHFKQAFFDIGLSANASNASATKMGNPTPTWYIKNVQDGTNFPVQLRSDRNVTLGWIKWSALQGYRTGGYTGDWADNSGKLAILHKKELVLNTSDTENILAAVDAIRGLTLGRLSPKQGMMTDIATAANGLEQNVHVEAIFPNVTNSKEIENALNNLTNVASQYANRKENY